MFLLSFSISWFRMVSMFKVLFLSALLAPCALAAPHLSGTVRDSMKRPIDGAKVTLWDAATGKGLQTLSSMGAFSLSDVAEDNYLFKVESDSLVPAYGAIHLSGDGAHKINVVMLAVASGTTESVGAGSGLRDAVQPPRDPSKPPKVKFPQDKKKVTPIYPDAARKAGVHGNVRIATILLPDGSLDDLVALSAPSRDLAVAALVAVRQWRYSPTQLDGEPVETSFTIDVEFDR
jgi:TonB family protein